MTETGAWETFRVFNLAEGCFWILLGLGFLAVLCRRRQNVGLMSATALLFLTFGLSDFVEIHTGGWYKPWWMLAWKAANLAGLVGVFLLFQRQTGGRLAGKEPQGWLSDRFCQTALILSTIAFSWLAMMVVHELGHVLQLWFTGGRVDYVVLHPLMISYTHPAANPHPLAVAWGGPLWGCLIPLGLLLAVRQTARRCAYLAAFFAGFCLIANGAYLAGDAFLRGGDGRDLILHGSPPWLLVLVGVPAMGLGLWLWNGLGRHFGLAPNRGKVDPYAAIGMMSGLAILVGLELVLAG
jgi:hypothetical protein